MLLEIVSGVDVESWFEAEGVEARSAAAFHASGKRLDLSEELVKGRHTPEEMAALELVERCWHPDSSSRPSMKECCDALVTEDRVASFNALAVIPIRRKTRKARKRGRMIASLWDQISPGLSDDEQEELFRSVSEVLERRKKAE